MKSIRIAIISLFSTVIMLAGMGVPVSAAVDVYTTPGEHLSGGREWRTWCDPYSQTARCTTQIKSGGGWVFNNLTYLPSPRALWTGNPLATPGEHLVAGRKWYTECETDRTGRNGCRSYIWEGARFVFNNIVQFGVIRSDLDSLYWYRPPTEQTNPPPAGSATDLRRGGNRSNRVILTYDDCPTSLTALKTTLRAATDLGVALALFPTGNCITAGKFDAAYARSLGHYVFNHSISHPYLTRVSYAEAVRQLGAPGVVATYGRPPYGDYNATVRRAYDAVGMRIWLWNYDTLDYQGASSAVLTRRVVTNAGPGDTVLMHMKWNGFNGPTIKAMRDGLAAKGIGMCRNHGPVEAKPAEVTC